MKKLFMLLVLLSGSVYSQNATLHFFYGTNSTLGAETTFLLRGSDSVWLGGGFSGTTENIRPEGQIENTEINAYNKSYKIDVLDEIWVSIYLVGSYGVIDDFIVKYKAGLGFYNNKLILDNYQHNKLYNKPMVGVGVLYKATKDVGIEFGVDNFNKFTIGFTLLY